MRKVSGLAAALVEFLSKILIERNFFQNNSITPIMVIYIVNDLIKLLDTEPTEKLSLYKEATIFYKQVRGKELTEDEKRYDKKIHELDVISEVANGIRYAVGFSVIKGMFNSISSAVSQRLGEHVPYIAGYTAAAYIGPMVLSKLVDIVLEKTDLTEEQKAILRPWLNSVGRLATGFIPKVEANERGVVYQKPSVSGHYEWYKNIVVSASSNAATPNPIFSGRENTSQPTDDDLSFKIVGVQTIELNKVGIIVSTKDHENLAVKFSLTEGQDHRDLRVECIDKTVEGECVNNLAKIFAVPTVQEKIINQLPTPRTPLVEETALKFSLDEESSSSDSLIDKAVNLASLAIPSMMAATVSPSLAVSTFFVIMASQVKQTSALTPNVEFQVNNPPPVSSGNVGFDPFLGAPRTAVATDSKGGVIVAYEEALLSGGGNIIVKSYNPDIAEQQVNTVAQSGAQAVPSVAISDDENLAVIVWQGQNEIFARTYMYNRTAITLVPLTAPFTVSAGGSTPEHAPQVTFRSDNSTIDVDFYWIPTSDYVVTQAVNATTGALIGSPIQLSNGVNDAIYPSASTAGNYRLRVWEETPGIMAQATDFVKGTSSSITNIGSPGGTAPIVSCAPTSIGIDCAVSVGSGAAEGVSTNVTLIPVSVDGTGATSLITAGSPVVMPGTFYSSFLTSVSLQQTQQAGTFRGLMACEGQLSPNGSYVVTAWRFIQNGTSINSIGPSFFPLSNLGGTNIVAPSVASLGDTFGNNTYIVVAPSFDGLGNETNGYDMTAIAFADGFNGTQPSTSPPSPSPTTTATTSSGTTVLNNSKKNSSNTGPIVGGVVGGVILLSAAAALAVYGIYRCRKNDSKWDIEMQPQPSRDDARSRSNASFADKLYIALGISNFSNFTTVGGEEFKEFAEQIERAISQNKFVEKNEMDQYAIKAANCIKAKGFVTNGQLDLDRTKSKYGAINIANDAIAPVSEQQERRPAP